MKNIILIDKKEFQDELYKTIEMFNVKDRIENFDTRKHICIQVMNCLKRLNNLKIV